MFVHRVMIGREPERQLLQALVAGTRGGSAGTLVVRDEPGVGKSALLDEVVAEAGDVTVLCVVHDAHWLDTATAAVLLFCAHQLGADRVALVFAARDGAWGRSTRRVYPSWP